MPNETPMRRWVFISAKRRITAGMKRRSIIMLLLMSVAIVGLGWHLAGPEQHEPGRPPTAPSAHHQENGSRDFRPLPFHDLARRVGRRYEGRLIGAQATRPTAEERGIGAALVYEFKLVTPQRNLLRVRLDARDGRFLDVAGRGQLQALRR